MTPQFSGTPVRVVVVGAGGMGRTWMRTVLDSDCAQLVGVADVISGAARAAIDELRPGLENLEHDVATGTDAVEVARASNAEAIIDVTVPEAHHPVTAAALSAGLPVLGEKPCAATLAEAVSLAAYSEATGLLFAVSQSRRHNPHLREARRLADSLGGAGIVDTRFYRAPRFGGFRDAMSHPLIVDMAIHAFDAARVLIDGTAMSVRATAHNPPWSWYEGAAAATVHVTYDNGSVHTFSGSWCSPGRETSWNGEWLISCEKGSVEWDGELPPVSFDTSGAPSPGRTPSIEDRWELASALWEFCAALRGGPTPSGEVHSNVWTQAIVEAAVRSADEDRVVMLAEMLDEALSSARDMDSPPAVREALSRWKDGPRGLGHR